MHSLILLGVVRSIYQLLEQNRTPSTAAQPEDAATRQPAPEFSAVTLTGVPITNRDFAGRPSAVLFVSPSCHSCSVTLSELEVLRYKAEGTVLVVCKGVRAECERMSAAHELGIPMVADEYGEMSGLFNVSAYPTAILIDEKNRIKTRGYPGRQELHDIHEIALAEKPLTAE